MREVAMVRDRMVFEERLRQSSAPVHGPTVQCVLDEVRRKNDTQSSEPSCERDGARGQEAEEGDAPSA